MCLCLLDGVDGQRCCFLACRLLASPAQTNMALETSRVSFAGVIVEPSILLVRKAHHTQWQACLIREIVWYFLLERS